jgi:hypothetical protein
MLKSLLKEPLFHFLVLALALFAAYGALNPVQTSKQDRIVMTSSKIEQLATQFASNWQRPPTAAELKALVDDAAKEEIYFREALALGLDKNDGLIRRRLRQKMEFLIDAEAEGMTPSDTELEAYLKANPAKFAADPVFAFQQIFLNPQLHGDRIDADAAAILEQLLAGDAANAANFGDATLLPSELALTGATEISQMFGGDFMAALRAAPQGRWTGPIKSAFGLHLVRVAEHRDGGVPPLGQVRGAVAREWANERRKALEEASFKQLLTRYEIVVENPAKAAASQ